MYLKFRQIHKYLFVFEVSWTYLRPFSARGFQSWMSLSLLILQNVAMIWTGACCFSHEGFGFCIKVMPPLRFKCCSNTGVVHHVAHVLDCNFFRGMWRQYEIIISPTEWMQPSNVERFILSTMANTSASTFTITTDDGRMSDRELFSPLHQPTCPKKLS